MAIIMDGNRRWARERDLPVAKGHEVGKESIEDVLKSALDMGIEYVSLWALSLDNMVKRSEDEVKHLMDLFRSGFLEILDEEAVHENEVEVNVLGRWREMLPDEVQEAIEKALETTEDYSKYHLNFLVSYSGRDEMKSAVEGIVEEEREEGNVEVTEDKIKEKLFTSDLPPVDLLIRTGGEPHNSTGFMMWDTSDSQYYFTETYWPEFHYEEFKEAIEDYRKRERRYGE
ncbi:MAG: polyprenyl diphosphate synthase [Candidatus Aenigmatarchaeota archaeon]